MANLSKSENTMKERPILFSGLMVKAILSGSKTQTRRIASKDHSATSIRWVENMETRPETGLHTGRYTGWIKECGAPLLIPMKCPYGSVGDRLWVRETWKPVHCDGSGTIYSATCEDGSIKGWKPSIHMHRFRSRITLEITGVRVERLQDISEADARAEGVESLAGGFYKAYRPVGQQVACLTAVASYVQLWESINGPGSWSANPYVWVLEFRRVKP